MTTAGPHPLIMVGAAWVMKAKASSVTVEFNLLTAFLIVVVVVGVAC